MTDIVDEKYRCKDCGLVHFFHVPCQLDELRKRAQELNEQIERIWLGWDELGWANKEPEA